MIPYEELCEALAQWRSKNGLANGPSAKMPQGPVIAAPPPAFAAAHTDESPLGAPDAVTASPPTAPEDPDAPTGVHAAAPPEPGETTNEIELESMLVRDEDV